MIPQIERIAEVAYYSVGIYIASVVAIPTRAMQQITSPITAKGMNDNNINFKNNDGDTPLRRASYRGQLKVVELLISHDADYSELMERYENEENEDK